ncbi:MAG: D-lactate dehydrogenase [Sphingomonas adhaesiva]|uniref:D-lactate dehydrogenase n=1 Tax=Sphingomonas adhaesiva TaxID=28212 RepID=UPI002FF77167
MDLLAQLRGIVGRRHVLTGARTRRFATGYRYGAGEVLAVVRPGTLVEQWRALAACVAADVIVIAQAANTGLTGGSTPDGAYDRPVVLMSVTRIAGIHPIDGGRQVVCLPGATLDRLEQLLAPLGREPHSVIGSSCIGASVIGGVCNNSGGALVRRGPAYTELALYAQVTADGRLTLVNHLGIPLGDDPESILTRAERGGFAPAPTDARASDDRYAAHVRATDADTPARFNADPARLFEASGSAGKVMLFAVRLDTFPRDRETATFYIGTNDPAEFTALRRAMLAPDMPLPISGEYVHRTAFDIADSYGKDTFLAIRTLGTARLPALFALRGWFDRVTRRPHLGDRLLQRLADRLPDHLPPRMRAYRDRFAHHLILKVADDGIAPTRAWLAAHMPDAHVECTAHEAQAAFLHRFAVAGAAVRYRAVHGGEVVALDFALRRNDADWSRDLTGDAAPAVRHALRYGHFFCHVFHHDYVVHADADAAAVEHTIHAALDACGAEYPAEHNVGHLYAAKPALADHYRALDPCNAFNPGIGHTPRTKGWRRG